MTLQYKMVKNKLPGRPYYARALRGNRRDLEYITPRIVKATSLNAPDIKATILALVEEVIDILKEGDVVVIDDFMTIYLTLSGSFDDPETVVTHDNIRVRFQVAFKAALTEPILQGLTFKQVDAQTKAPLINRFVDMATEQQGVYTAGSIIRIRGQNLTFDKNQPDQGVFLQAETGEEIRLTVYATTGHRQIDALVPADVVGDLQVLVRTRYTPTGSLRVGQYQEVVRPTLQ